MYTDTKVVSSIYQILDLLYALHICILPHVSSLRNFYQILPFSYLLLYISNMDCITLGTMPIQIKEIYQYMYK